MKMAGSSTNSSASERNGSSKERFQWKTNKTANLIQCLAIYKSQMEFDNSDFNPISETILILFFRHS